MKLAVFILCLTAFLHNHVIAQSPVAERLFCGSCGEENRITASFCGVCGERLDTRAMTRRLLARLTQAERDSIPVTMTPDEIRVLARIEPEQQARTFERKSSPSSSRPQTELDRILTLVAPVAIGVGALYLSTVVAATVFK